MERLLVVDGSNLLFQMFYGMPARIIGRHGRPIHGTVGFIGALLKMIRMVKPSHVLVVFDGECGNPRKDLDEDYKANRPDYRDMPEDEIPFSQLPDIFRALEQLGIRYAETRCCEADDWMAGYCLKYGNTMQVVVASMDSDLFQLITENVRILRYRGDNSILCDGAYIQEKLGIFPSQYADFKSLTGDSSDNIRGASHVGPKTAAALLRQFPDLESLIAGWERIAKPSVRTSIRQQAQHLRLNYQLIKLTGAEDLPYPIEALGYTYRGQTSTQILTATGIR